MHKTLPQYIPIESLTKKRYDEDYNLVYYDDPFTYHRHENLGCLRLLSSGRMRGKSSEEGKFIVQIYFEIMLGVWLMSKNEDERRLLTQDDVRMM